MRHASAGEDVRRRRRVHHAQYPVLLLRVRLDHLRHALRELRAVETNLNFPVYPVSSTADRDTLRGSNSSAFAGTSTVRSSMSAIFQVLTSAHLRVPLWTTIDDRRVQAIYIGIRILTFLGAIGFFVFGIRGWSTLAPVVVQNNLWLGGKQKPENHWSNGGGVPNYCDNEDYDFVYDADFQFQNTTCGILPLNLRFSKGVAPGAFFVSTFVQTYQNSLCPNSLRTTRDIADMTGSNICDTDAQTRRFNIQNQFVLDVDHYTISARTHVYVPLYGDFNSHKAKRMRHIAVLRNGSEVDISERLDQTLSAWLQLFELSLDDGNPDAAVDDSNGIPKCRLTGLQLNIAIEVRNVRGLFDFPGDVYARWILEGEPSWTRVILPDQNSDNAISSTDAYGVRWVFRTKESRVYIWSTGAFFTSIFDVVIFFALMRYAATKLALLCFGTDSARWRGVVNPRVETLDMSRRQRYSAQTAASSVTATATVVPLPAFEEKDGSKAAGSVMDDADA